MNKKVEDALCMLLHCSLKVKEYETQKEQFDFVVNYINNLKQSLNEIEVYIESLPTREQRLFSFIPTDVKEHILQIIDKVLGDEK